MLTPTASDCDDGRPLHVVEAREDDALTVFALLADGLRALGGAASERPSVAVIGPLSAARAATAAGCRVVHRVCPPLRDPRLGARSIRSMVRALTAGSTARPIVLWGSSTAAGVVAEVARPLRWCATGAVESLGRGLRGSLREVEAIAFSPAHAADVARVAEGATIRTVTPWVGGRTLEGPSAVAARASLRARWSVDASTVVVGLIGPSIGWTDFRRAADIVGIAAVRGARVRLVGHPAMPRAGMTMRWMADIALEQDPLLLDPEIAAPWAVAEGIDVGLVLGDGISTAGAAAAGQRGAWRFGGVAEPRIRPDAAPVWAALWWSAAGKPLLVERDAIPAEMVGAEGDAVFPSLDPLRATRALLDWCSHPERRREAGERGRALAPAALPPAEWRDVLAGRPLAAALR